MYDRRTDHNTIGKAADAGGVGTSFNAKTNADRCPGLRADLGDALGSACGALEV
jgi:hypothetical protein